MYKKKKGCKNASQSLRVSTSETLSKQTFLSLFLNSALTEQHKETQRVDVSDLHMETQPVLLGLICASALASHRPCQPS